MMAVPSWPGADACYSKAYRVLERMAANGGVRVSYCYPRGMTCYPSEDMNRLIDALNSGDEEAIKGLLMMDHVYPIEELLERVAKLNGWLNEHETALAKARRGVDDARRQTAKSTVTEETTDG